MNRQRKIIITVIYYDLGIIVDTKAEEFDLSANLQQTCKEVVRCGDCRYSRDEYGDGDCYCKRPGRELQWIGRRWDFFCAAGRKRGDGE